ncbi:hypothetical protein EsDP_00007376 [Epichloe bromicola]|uniref:Uncharacterized protein n=1 Tax=Epichloe bromicola TaxID=79588 RepID=A0ABQ0D0Q9_9HYPO
MPRKTGWGSTKTPPRRQRQQRQTTQLGELDTTPTRPSASPNLPEQQNQHGDVSERSIHENSGSDGFENGIEDGDLVQLADTQAIPETTVSKGFSWSETGSGARRSSSVSSGGTPKGFYGYLGVDTAFSSPVSGIDALPDTVPLPIDLTHDPLLGDKKQAPVIVDFSETATTVVRSSPMTGSRFSRGTCASSYRDFVDGARVDDSINQTPSQLILVDTTEPGALQSGKIIKTSAKESPNGSVLLDSAQAVDEATHDVRSVTNKTTDHRRGDTSLTTHFVSLDGAADRLDNGEGAILDKTEVAVDGNKHKRKRKQRPKSPLQFDDDTQVVKPVIKKPVLKKSRQKPRCKIVKPGSPPLETLAKHEEVEERVLRNKPVKSANSKCSATTGRQSPPVDMTDNMHEDAPNIPSQCPVENTKDSLLEDQADNSFDPREEDAVEIPDEVQAERHIKSPSSFRANIQISLDSSSHTPPASPNENKDNATTHEATVEEPVRREKPTTSVQADNEKDDEFSAQKPLRAEVHSPLQHNIQPSSQLHHLVATKSAHGQNGKRSSARKTSGGGKHSLIAVPPGRHISVSGQGSPIRLSHLEDNDVNSIPAEVPPLIIWESTGYTGRLGGPVVEATQHESNQGSNFAVALEIESSRPVSPAGLEGNLGLRQSILSELKKEHANRRIASGQAKTHVSEPADHGRQQLHALVDVRKKTWQIKIAFQDLSNVP